MSATDLPFERLEALLRGDEPRTLDEKRSASVLAELRAATLQAPESLRERVLAGAPAVRRRRVSLPRRRLVLVVVPVAVALAVGAALVHGFVDSGTEKVPFAAEKLGAVGSAAHRSARALAPKKAWTPAATPKPGGVSGNTVASGTVYNAEQSVGGKLLGPLKAGKQVVIPTNRPVHADANLQVQVPDRTALARATNRATRIVTSLGGYAQSVHYESAHQGYGSAVLSLRVPVQKAQVAIGRLGGLGTLLSQTVSTQDLSQQLTRQTNGIGSLRRAIAVYEQALQSGTLSASDRVTIQIRLENARHSLTQLRRAHTGTLAYAATADVSLLLTTRGHGIVVPHHKNGQFGRMLGDAAHFLGLEGIVVLYALVVLSPVLLLGGLGWALWRERRRRDERRLLAGT